MISIVQCPKCGWLQVSQALKTFKCRRCNTNASLSKVKVIRVVNNLSTAQLIIKQLRNTH